MNKSILKNKMNFAAGSRIKAFFVKYVEPFIKTGFRISPINICVFTSFILCILFPSLLQVSTECQLFKPGLFKLSQVSPNKCPIHYHMRLNFRISHGCSVAIVINQATGAPKEFPASLSRRRTSVSLQPLMSDKHWHMGSRSGVLGRKPLVIHRTKPCQFSVQERPICRFECPSLFEQGRSIGVADFIST